MVGRELTLLPNIFSTLLLAYEKTDFVSFIHHVAMNGSTVFAPTNEAFARLGPRANAFLFNTEPGKKYLTALLKYQIVTNTTLYSDAIYSATETETEVVNRPGSRDVKAKETYLVTLPTLLDGKDVLVRVSGWGPTRHITVNGVVDVVVMDVVAKNGVIQVVGSVPIPPHPHKGDFVGGEIEVEDLKERLDVFVGETTPEFSVEL